MRTITGIHTSFVGREPELATIAALLSSGRLVTLTGPGGVGKTRLALAAIAAAAEHFPGGVGVVDLSALCEPAQVLPAATRELRGIEPPIAHGQEEREARLGPRLLLLDNFEHLLAAAPAVGELLAADPALTVLVTSRAVLRVSGEHEFRVAPLDLLDEKALATPETLLASASGRLFVERARQAHPTFTLTPEHAPAVAAICRRLEGLPLAIELAASRVRLLPPPALLARLERRLPLLIGGPRDAPARHQTLRATIAWSTGLLTPVARRLLRDLAVFADGADITAIEALGARRGAHAAEPLDALTELCEHHLILCGGTAPEPRYSLPELVREYATEELAATGEEAELRAWHGAYFLALAERAGPQITGAGQAGWFARLVSDEGNIRAALGWARAQNDLAGVLRAGAALCRYWWLRGLATEGRELLTWALGTDQPAIDRRVRAGALQAAGYLAFVQGDLEMAEPLLQHCVAFYQAEGDLSGEATARNSLGLVAYEREALAIAREHFEACLSLRRQIGEVAALGTPLNNLAAVALRQGDLQEARRGYETASRIFRAARDQAWLAQVQLHLASVLIRLRDVAGARACLAEALALAEALQARALLIEGIELTARLASLDEQGVTASQLFAVAEVVRIRYGLPPTSTDVAAATEHLVRLRQTLGPEALAEAWRAGRALALGPAIELARSALAARAPEASSPPQQPHPMRGNAPHTLLTEREQEVLALLVEGHPNKVIAEQLHISPYTVHAHLRSIYSKLDVRTRSAAVRYTLQQQMRAVR